MTKKSKGKIERPDIIKNNIFSIIIDYLRREIALNYLFNLTVII